jgi:NAD+ diphosphatase
MPTYTYCPHCASLLEPAPAGGRERLVCSARCGFVFWNNPLPVVGVLVEYDHDTVLLVQNKGWPADWFGLVSGFIEAGEEPHEAALREVQEELGLTATLVEHLGVYPFPQRNELILAYHVRASGEIMMNTDELQAVKPVPIARLKAWPFGTGLAVRDWLERRQQGTTS